MKFRSDVNGLRAIAVMAVVIFHFNPQWLSGGFIGVDVFFVISGFLMTSIIFGGIDNHKFNLFSFYNARANRIFPALSFMMLTLLAVGWFYLLPSEYKDLAHQIKKASLFVSNGFFAKEGGYFDSGEDTKWLLHTWSLSVEWQFYLGYPVIILLLKKYFSSAIVKKIIFSAFLCSLFLSVYLSIKQIDSAYFFLSARIWEMLLGGFSFLYPVSSLNDKYKKIAHWFGFLFILFSCFFISQKFYWPGFIAIIPTVGTYLVLASNEPGNIFLNNKISEYIGKSSYSIYIWHWPIVVFGYYSAISEWWVVGIPLSFLLGFGSYFLIEKIKFKKYDSWKYSYRVIPIYMIGFVFLLAFFVKSSDGFSMRIPENVSEILNEASNVNPYGCERNSLYECTIGNPSNIKAIMIGDSHSDALVTSLSSVFDLREAGVAALSSSACPLISDIRFYDKKIPCPVINNERFLLIDSGKYIRIPLVLVGRYAYYLMGENDFDRVAKSKVKSVAYFGDDPDISYDARFTLFEKNLNLTLCRLAKKNPVYIVQPVPELGFNAPKTMAKNLWHHQKQPMSVSVADYQARTKRVRDIIDRAAKNCGVTVLDPAKILCASGRCIAQKNKRSLYRDGDHLSEYGNKLLAPMFQEVRR